MATPGPAARNCAVFQLATGRKSREIETARPSRNSTRASLLGSLVLWPMLLCGLRFDLLEEPRLLYVPRDALLIAQRMERHLHLRGESGLHADEARFAVCRLDLEVIYGG